MCVVNLCVVNLLSIIFEEGHFSILALTVISQLRLQQATPKVRVVDPIDYEGELTARKKDVEKEKYLPLLLFPQQDVTVSCRINGKRRGELTCFPQQQVTSEGWNYRTHTCSVPEDAHQPALNLLASEVVACVHNVLL